MVALSPFRLLGWGGEWKGKAKLMGWDKGSFNRTANEAFSNDSNTDKENI